MLWLVSGIPSDYSHFPTLDISLYLWCISLVYYIRAVRLVPGNNAHFFVISRLYYSIILMTPDNFDADR